MPDSSRLVMVHEWSGKYVVNEAYRDIARALVEKFSELRHITVNDILFVDNTEGSGKNKDKYRNAQIGKIPAKWEEILYQLTGHEFWYCMEFFKRNIENMSREQIIALIYHELRHIGVDGETKTHDIEDWANMTIKLGPDWSNTRRGIPNLLDEDFNWDDITGPRLFDEHLRAVK